ncbi:TetR/AcrR family transcriptional regulator [Anaerostipes sp.]|uniref:TetR/AcrR family transcriptional regulator n=1 Tax=Anaerostipes sp. TaxID=1872530 RepID=UPI0025C160D3|nr:TetR/AcrR family transcriptional regulator [Anaerostipes sp.]MBS7007757.1 TetR/AcrR family transcriptional regulator [Anaerostipes sp.]
MNEKFLNLEKEKRQKIIDSAIQVFAENDYKHASTDQMAALAGISKGLLFYYFKNKKTLYLYLYDHIMETIITLIEDTNFKDVHDFFELFELSIRVKSELMKKNPFINGFILKAKYEDNEAVKEELEERNQIFLQEMFPRWFPEVDFSKFREDVSPEDVFMLLYYLGDGYMRDAVRQPDFDLDRICGDYKRWMGWVKKSVYREECL